MMAKRRFIDNSTPTAAPGLGGSPGMKAGYAGSPGSDCDPCCPPPEEEPEPPTPCCTGFVLPDTLFATVAGEGGEEGGGTLTQLDSELDWSTPGDSIEMCDSRFLVGISCEDGVWTGLLVCEAGFGTHRVEATVISCDPFEAEFEVTDVSSAVGCVGTCDTLSIVITE